MISFVRRFRERKLGQWGIAYLGGAWLVLQVASLVGNQFGWPEWILRSLTVVLAVGFPTVLLLAWCHGETGQRRFGLVEGLAFAGLFVAAGVGIAIFGHNRETVSERLASLNDKIALAVLPFQNLNDDPEQQYLVEGLADALTGELAGFDGVRIISRGATAKYAGRRRSVREIAAELGVEALVEGSVLRAGNNVRVTVQLLPADPDRPEWSETYEHEIGDLPLLQRDFARAFAQAIELKLSRKDEQRLANAAPVDPAVYELYLRGRFFWNKREEDTLPKAVEYFQQAIDKDSTFAPAYSGLADTYLTMLDYEILDRHEATTKAREAVQKALQLDDNLGEAHNSLAHLYLHDWNWTAAEREFLRAIELDPNNAATFHWYALCLTARGRADEAVQVMHVAQRLDPLSVRINTDLGMAYYAAGQFDEAIAQETKLLDLDPDFRAAFWIRGMAYEGKKEYANAIGNFQEALKRNPTSANVLAALAHTYAVSGRPEEARRIVADLEARAAEGVSPFVIALVYAGLGEADPAFAWLTKAYDMRDGSVRYLKIDPRLAGIRADPRFDELMKHVGLTG